MNEPRFMLIDLKTMKQVQLTTDEVQAALFNAELKRRLHDTKTSAASDQVPVMPRNHGRNAD